MYFIVDFLLEKATAYYRFGINNRFICNV